METTNYDVDDMIKFFNSFDESMWHVGAYSNGGGKYCAAGLCGAHEFKSTPRADALNILFSDHLKASIPHINDGLDMRYQQPTPKQRILAALRDIKAKQEPQCAVEKLLTPAKERVVYVAMDKKVRKLGKAKLSVN